MSEQAAGRERFGKLKIAGCVAVGALALNVAADKLGIDLGVFNSETTTDFEQPTTIVRSIEPIDIGCFVQVEAQMDMVAHLRRRVSAGPFTKTAWTNTTKTTAKGESRLCVDNELTDITVTERTEWAGDEPQTTKTMDVTIGRLYPEGKVVHDGTTKSDTNDAFGERLGKLFGGDGSSEDVQEGLNIIAERLATRSACVDESVEVAKSQIRKHYEKLGRQIGGIESENITITYAAPMPATQEIPTGENVDEALAGLGIELSDNLDIGIENPVCSVALVNDIPLVEGAQKER